MSPRTLSLASAFLLLAAAASAQPDQRRSTLPGASVDQMHARAQPHGGGAPVHPAYSRPPSGQGREPQHSGPGPQPHEGSPAGRPHGYAPYAGPPTVHRYAPPQGDRRAPPTAEGRFAGPHWRPDRYPHAFASDHRFYGPVYHPPRGYDYRVWRYGDILPPIWWTPDYQIWDWWNYDLPMPPPGYVWVRVGLDALLIDPYGRVVQVVNTLFW